MKSRLIKKRELGKYRYFERDKNSLYRFSKFSDLEYFNQLDNVWKMSFHKKYELEKSSELTQQIAKIRCPLAFYESKKT